MSKMQVTPPRVVAGHTPGQAGHYITTPPQALGSTLPGNGVLYLIRVVPNRVLTLDRLAVNVTVVGSVGSLCRLGIYNDDGSDLPGSLLLDGGTVDTNAATGLRTVTISQVLQPRPYWFCAAQQGAPATAATYTSFTAVSGAVPAAVPAGIMSGRAVLNVTGALPSASPGTLLAPDGAVYLRVMGRVA